MQRASLRGRGKPSRGTVAARTARLGATISIGAAAALLTGSARAATFDPATGTLSAQVASNPVDTKPAAIGTVNTQSQFSVENPPTFAISTTTITLQVANSSRYNYFGNSLLSSSGPAGQGSFSFTQRFTTTAPQWIELSAEVNTEPFGNPEATASVTLGRVGQTPTFQVGYTFGVTNRYAAAFAAGNFDLKGSAGTSSTSGLVTRRGSVEGDVLIAAIADFNGSGTVNNADLATWRAGFGSQSGAFANGNLDDNTSVDGRDFLLWQRQYGISVPVTAAGAIIPEPASMALAAVTALLLGLNRSGRRRSRMSR